jgi:small subunit ribosomal protein S7
VPRRGKVVRHRTPPDAKYNSVWVQVMINKVMKCGKKSTAERIVYEALDQMGQRKEDPRTVSSRRCNTMPVPSAPPPGRWRGIDPRGPPGEADPRGDALIRIRAGPLRAPHGGALGRGAPRRLPRAGRRNQEAG